MLIYNSAKDYYYTSANAEDGKAYVTHIIEGDYYNKSQTLSVRDLEDDIISITIHEYHTDRETMKTTEDLPSEHGNLFVTREHALEFANAIIEALGK
jgi:hypothetical protein